MVEPIVDRGFSPHPPPDRILVATDFSSAARRALEQAAWMARAGGGEILLVHVAETELVRAAGGVAPLTVEAAHAEAMLQARILISEVARGIASEGIPVRSRIEEGNVPDAILREATHERADLLVIGTHGLGGFKRFFLGSVALGVAKRATVPVLLVR